MQENKLMGYWNEKQQSWAELGVASWCINLESQPGDTKNNK